jgi:hypothetical protein
LIATTEIKYLLNLITELLKTRFQTEWELKGVPVIAKDLENGTLRLQKRY